MPELREGATASVVQKRTGHGDEGGQLPKVVVCAETASSAAKVIPQALALSRALRTELLLLHVVEPGQAPQTPFDPFEWDLRRREAEAFVSELSKQYGSKDNKIQTQVVEGRSSEQICSCFVENTEDIAALCRSDVELPGHIGQTARHVLEKASGSVLIVPASAAENEAVKYDRILVPLDGSARAESALPLAKKIAQAENAELILVHAVPNPMLTEVGPLDNEDIELRDSLLRRNERVARDYLAHVCENLKTSGVEATSTVLSGGDARHLLNEAISAESANLVVLSSHGHSGHAEVATGDVTSYLLAYSTVPVLMIRCSRGNGNHGNGHFYRSVETRGVRRPTGAN